MDEEMMDVNTVPKKMGKRHSVDMKEWMESVKD